MMDVNGARFDHALDGAKDWRGVTTDTELVAQAMREVA